MLGYFFYVLLPCDTRISGYEVYIQVPRDWWFHDHVTFLTCTVRLLRVRPVRRQKKKVKRCVSRNYIMYIRAIST